MMSVSLSSDELDAMYPRLFNLIGGYFHQDWYTQYGGSAQAALDDYMAAFNRFELQETAVEIDALLDKSDDAELARILEILDNNFMYENHGYTSRTWLETIRKNLDSFSK